MRLIARRNLSLLFCICIGCVLIVDAEKEIPATKFGKNIGTPTMSFYYCYSCGYRKAYEDYVNILAEKYPQIVPSGENYEPPGFNLYYSRMIFALKILLIAAILAPYNLFEYVGLREPRWWNTLKLNKMYAAMMIFFVGSMLEGQLVSSGAFEITLNGVPVWSKLQTGRIPAPLELFQIIDNQLLQFQDNIQENPDFVK